MTTPRQVEGLQGFFQAWIAMVVLLGLGALITFGVGLMVFTDQWLGGGGLIVIAFLLASRWQAKKR